MGVGVCSAYTRVCVCARAACETDCAAGVQSFPVSWFRKDVGMTT